MVIDKKIWGIIQRENKNMLELARRLKFKIVSDPDDTQVEAILTMIQ
jgi:hypothetical protein